MKVGWIRLYQITVEPVIKFQDCFRRAIIPTKYIMKNRADLGGNNYHYLRFQLNYFYYMYFRRNWLCAYHTMSTLDQCHSSFSGLLAEFDISQSNFIYFIRIFHHFFKNIHTHGMFHSLHFKILIPSICVQCQVFWKKGVIHVSVERVASVLKILFPLKLASVPDNPK